MFENNPSIATKLFGYKIGKILPGYRADLAIFDYYPRTPINDSTIFGHIFFGLSNPPSDVITRGEFRIKNSELLGISEKEINNVVKFVKNQLKPDFSKDITSEINLQSMENKFGQNNEVVDDLYDKAVNIVVTEKRASTSFIQRHLQIGYNRAARIIEQMEREGIVSEGNHVGKREVLKKSV